MSEKKELKIDKTIIQSILVGFIVALIIILIIQHFGSFLYLPGTKARWYNSPFGYRYDFIGEGLNLSYLKELGIYLKTTFVHFKYILYFWVPISGLFIILKKYNIKLN